MNTDANERERAADIALKSTEEFRFDYREIVSCTLVEDFNGAALFRIVIRLWLSPESIENIIAKSGDGQEADLIRTFLSEGSEIAVDVTQDRVFKQEWLGIDFCH